MQPKFRSVQIPSARVCFTISEATQPGIRQATIGVHADPQGSAPMVELTTQDESIVNDIEIIIDTADHEERATFIRQVMDKLDCWHRGYLSDRMSAALNAIAEMK